MRCTNKRKYFAVGILSVALLLGGCGKQTFIEKPYDISHSATNAAPTNILADEEQQESLCFFADDLCVAKNEQTVSDHVTESVVEAMGVFLPEQKEITYQKNIYEKLYPASTTKIMTAYLALQHGNLDDVVTVSEHATDQASDSSVCNLRAGDQIKLRDLLYGLMLRSGNDAAVAIAEHISGSEESFATLMNETARSFGATNTHFVNPNGLHDEAHYTCVYDMYLIFSHALTLDDFLQLIQTRSYTAYFSSADGSEKSQSWTNTNKYINGDTTLPDEVTVLGGKTGTTNAAGHCLAVYAQNEKKQPVISIIFKADGRSNLYYVMNQLLNNFSNG